MVEKLLKDSPTAEVLLEAKAAALHPERYHLNYLQRGRVRQGKKRRQSDWLANQMDRKVMDRQTDRQVETRSMSAGTQADRAAS